MKKLLAVIAVVLVFAFCLPVCAMAVPSPVIPSEYECEVSPNNANAGSVNKVDKGENVYEIIATPANGYKFVNWTIEGNYVVKEGSLTGTRVVIELSSDVKAVANFNAKGSDGDKDPTSPPSGDVVYLIAIACLVALAGAGFAFKKARA